MAYNKKYYKKSKAAKKIEKKIKSSKQFKELKKRIALALAGLCVLLSAAITLSTILGGPLPTWQDIYRYFDLVHPDVVHTNAYVEPTNTKIHFIDVGQGDSTLIEQDGEFCLIDAGEKKYADDVVGYLKANGVEYIELLVLTHEHSDHIGGIIDIIENFEIEKVLLPDFDNHSFEKNELMTETLQVISEYKIPQLVPQMYDKYQIGEGTLEIISTGLEGTDNPNNTSIVTMFSYNNFKVLICGDAEDEQTREIINNGINVNANVYKASHHGATDSNKQKWVDAIMPDIISISCGLNNSYGHPSAKAMEVFDNGYSQILRTDYSGNIVVGFSDDNEIFISRQYDDYYEDDLANAA